jgi:hypothetical protein
VQSTTLLLLAVEGRIPRPDLAVFADTGWEPAAVYEHLNRVTEVAASAGIPVRVVSVGNIRNDALDPERRFASMPLHVLNPDGSRGLARRQCTSEYKIRPIKQAVREFLGYPHPKPVPAGVYVHQQVGISRDEVGRAKDSDVRYARNVFPLVDLDGAADGRPGWTRSDCARYLTAYGWGDTPRSACIGCPFNGNARWRNLRDTDPAGWADAVDFDAAIRNGSAKANAAGQPLYGQMFLHRSMQPLDAAPIDRVTAYEWAGRQVDVFEAIADTDDEDPPGCSPFACRDDGA